MHLKKFENMNDGKRKPKLSIILFLLFILIGGCTTVEYYIRGRALAESDQISGNSLVYALPRTMLYFEVTVKKTTYKHGPYYRYAEKYIGITDASDDDWEEWTIDDIRIDAK
ncbi:MAG: DUF4831 family protein, partial [Bacteroidales bacterium]